MTIPVIAEHDVTVYQGDVREQLAGLSDGSVQCVVTSPPYYGLRDYGCDGQIGLEASPAEYVATMRAVFAEARRVLAADGVLWLNLGDSYSSASGGAPTSANTRGLDPDTPRTIRPRAQDFVPPKNLLGIPWRVAFALQDDGWTLRNAVIWHKPNAMPESVTDRLSTRYEHLFLFAKSRRYRFDLDAIREQPKTDLPVKHWTDRTHDQSFLPAAMRQANGVKGRVSGVAGYGDGGRNPGDVWTIPTSPFPGAHFACMPPALAERCILAGCPESGTVLDPFAGSGTTLMVARKLARKAIGVELNPAYVDIIRQRIGDTPFDFGEATA